MPNENTFENYDYLLIKSHKYKTAENIYSCFIKERNSGEWNELNISIISLISLYLTDADTVKKELYSEKEINYINKLVDIANKNIEQIEHLRISLTHEDMLHILLNYTNKRVDVSLNKKIVLLLFKIYGTDSLGHPNLEKLVDSLNKLDLYTQEGF